jgi:asparagine synthase (glutamine-hydrolysing)
MCGINGIYAYRDAAPPVDEAELLRVREAMAQRGPDGAGNWSSPDRRVALASRRLAIIDRSAAGSQPMASADGRWVMVFNGEIYNHRALRRELEAAGAAFRSNSDTEVLLQLYAREGAGMLERLRGMYAFAIWDAVERRLFLARDPFGIKPLYYVDDGSTLRFASQVGALRAGGAIDAMPDPAGRAGFLLWGFVPEPFTLFRAIRALPAGTSLLIDRRGAAAPRKFFDLAAEYAAAGDRRGSLEELGAALERSVARHLVSDVPVSVFLSAGIDSSAIATLATRAASDLRCITLGFEEYRGRPADETRLASELAAKLGARHSIDWIGRPAFYDELPDVMAAMDQPSIDGVNTYFVARAAARQGLKVALSGLGGDELLLGYPSFRDVPRMMRAFGFAQRLPRPIGRSFRALSAPLLRLFTSPKYAGLIEYGGSHEGAYLLRRGLFMPWELPSLLGAQEAREGWERLRPLAALSAARQGVSSDAAVVSCLELAWYMRGMLLRDADWAGMAHSVEIRVPFLDVDVLRAAAPLAARGGLHAKRDLAALPLLDLPRSLREREKTGFQVPVREWLAGIAPARATERGLRGWARKVLFHFTAERSYLGLVTDAYGARGGIALYGRDFLGSVCSHGATDAVVAIPRRAPEPREPLPVKLHFETDGADGKLRYALAVARTVLARRHFDMVVCGHINLLPLAYAAAKVVRAPLLLLVYGVDAWTPRRRWLAHLLAPRADAVIAISETTLSAFRRWSGVPQERCAVLPNAIHLEHYGDGAKKEALLERYGLRGRKVIMTLARLAADERYKGVDEVLELMPRLVRRVPGLRYLVAGDGSDRPRLQAKAAALGLNGHVVFAGYVAEEEKADHYRLADAFVMPSRGEGFGFVFLEALACGTPVVASRTDGGREALRDGMLGRLVDPGNSDELAEAICESVAAPRAVPPGLDYFEFANFERRCHRVLEKVMLLAGR